MNLSINDNRVNDLRITQEEFDESSSELFSLDFSPRFIDGKAYSIIFNISLAHPENIRVDLIFESFFDTDEDMDDKFKGSPFISVNSPAIAYPFLRAYVASTLLASGYAPAMLPTINFTTFSKKD